MIQENPRQHPDKRRTRLPDKENKQSQSSRGIQPDSTTGGLNYGIRLKGNTGIRGNVIPLLSPKRSEDQRIKRLMNGWLITIVIIKFYTT